jgi:p-cumate 2,3-dioxygenase beta subunit
MTTGIVQGQHTRLEVEDFLYHEAALLDEWRLDDWTELFTEDAQYVVPATDYLKGTPSESLVLLTDNLYRIKARVTRLNSRRAHREFPWSRTRRIISNVRVLEERDDELDITANFVVYRIRKDVTAYVGQYFYTLVRNGDSFLIRHRRAELGFEALRPHGTLSIIL